jgi:hypothetical protein
MGLNCNNHRNIKLDYEIMRVAAYVFTLLIVLLAVALYFITPSVGNGREGKLFKDFPANSE